MTTIRFSIETAPEITLNAEGKRSSNGGNFTTGRRMERDVFAIAKAAGAYYRSAEEVEDGIGSNAGWNYPTKSLIALMKAGHIVRLQGEDCKNFTELLNRIETIAAEDAAEEKRIAEAKAQREADYKALVDEMSQSLKLYIDSSWDDFRFTIGDVLTTRGKYEARQYFFEGQLAGFIIK